MQEIRPVVIVGIGPQSQKTVQQYVRLVNERQGPIPALLPAILSYSPRTASFKYEREGIHYFTLSSPVFEGESEWPLWLPPELDQLSSAQRDGTRAWMRAALLQRIDDLQEFWLERIPRLLSFPTIEQLAEQGLQLAGNSEIDIHIVADLGDSLGSGVLADVACTVAAVCHQVGLAPLVSGFLYLPDATSPAPIEEAVAYAALKEIEYYAAGHAYAGESGPLDLGAGGSDLLNNGCYLLDTVNEAGYTLQDEDQLAATVCEQLYAMTFLNLETAVREHRERRYQRATLRGKARVYESFGVAIRYVPRRILLEWASARLGGDIIESILESQTEVSTDQKVRSFVERVGLRAESLESALRQIDVTQRVKELLTSLHHVGVKQLDSRSRTILQTLREQYLPVLNARVEERSAQEMEHIQEALSEEVQIALEDMPAGGISNVLSFLKQLDGRLDELESDVEEQSRRHQAELSRSLGTVSETYYALRNVTMGTPPWPVTLLSVVAALLLPVLYQILLIYRVVLPQNAAWALGVSAILLCSVLGVSGFVGYRLIRQRRILSRQHAHMIGERFHLESDPLIQREKGAIYAEMRAIICSAQSDLETLVTQLQAVLARFRQEQDRLGRRLQELTLPGPSRSAVDVGIAEHFFEAAVPDIEQLVGSLAQSDSLVADWLVRCIETPDSFRSWFYDHVGQFGARCLEQTVGEFSVVDALTSNGTRLESVVERLFERAYPLWNYDPRFLRRAKTQRMTFIGANTQESSWPMLSELVGDAQPEAIVHHTDDPSALIVMAIHRGVPLFALRRIGQYRTHYAEALWRGKLPIHTTNNLALATDLVPMRRRPRVIPATLFSTGLALNVIHRDPDGRYVAPRGQGKTIRLSANKERSVALMGMDGPTCRQVQRRLDALVAQQGKAAIGARLEQYTTDASDLADWEIKGIVEFGRSYERENGNLTSEKASRSQPSKATKSLERAP